jgi:hypothetical protein
MFTLLLAAVANIVVAPVPKGATFGNWTVACDNRRHCEAIGLPSPDGDETEGVLYVERGPAPKAKPKVEINNLTEPNFERVRLRIDGRDVPFRFDRDGFAVGDSEALLAAIVVARKVEVIDANGKAISSIPVTGSSAALRWVDDRQKRAGTVTAIVAKGDGPASSVPAPPPLPRIMQPPESKAPARKLRPADVKAIKSLADGDCDEDVKDVETYRLDARHSVGIVGCYMGAYQGASLVVVIDEAGHWRPAEIEQPRPIDPVDGKVNPVDFFFLTGAYYDPDSRLLGMAAKGRGLADCGESATWAWDGKTFRLASFQALDECLGAPTGTWLSRWQTANDPLKDE